MAQNTTYDLIVIGAGPGGYVGAIRAAQLGMKTAVIEKDKPGGVCLNIGCIPSKALIHQANRYAALDEYEAFGISMDRTHFAYKHVFQKSRNAADKLSKGVGFLLRKNNIDLIKGTAAIVAQGKVSVDGKDEYRASNIMIASGSSPRRIPGFEFDGKRILSSNDALMLTELPQSLLILGGGAIGVEFAHIMNAFGVEVTIVEMLERILPLEDAETAAVLRKSFEKRGIRFMTNTNATGVKKHKSGLSVSVEPAEGDARQIQCEKMLVVVGRAPNSANLGIEQFGIEISRGYIQTGDYYQTKAKGVFAVGDVIDTPMLAHVASKEAEIAVEYMAGKNPEKRLDPDLIPSAVYCEPQLASFGPTEERAKRSDLAYKKAVFPYRGAGKAVAIEEAEGMVKILYRPELREIIAAHIVGAEATELVHEILLAKASELLPEDIAKMVHAHPTLSEAVMEGMRAAEGWAIHI